MPPSRSPRRRTTVHPAMGRTMAPEGRRRTVRPAGPSRVVCGRRTGTTGHLPSTATNTATDTARHSAGQFTGRTSGLAGPDREGRLFGGRGPVARPLLTVQGPRRGGGPPVAPLAPVPQHLAHHIETTAPEEGHRRVARLLDDPDIDQFTHPTSHFALHLRFPLPLPTGVRRADWNLKLIRCDVRKAAHHTGPGGRRAVTGPRVPPVPRSGACDTGTAGDEVGSSSPRHRPTHQGQPARCDP